MQIGGRGLGSGHASSVRVRLFSLLMLTRLFSQRSWLLSLLVSLFFLGLISLRAWPAYFRGTYATEGGEWLSQFWRDGFWSSLFTIRPDYPVLGNLLVIKVAEMLTTLIGGHPLAAVGPNLQHLVASGYVALIFLGIFTNLRRHQGAAWSLGITLFMLAMPDLDNENRIFGEANNVGYFSALAVLFVYYDFWLSETVSPRRLLCWLAWVVFHILTSPMAGVRPSMPIRCRPSKVAKRVCISVCPVDISAGAFAITYVSSTRVSGCSVP